MIFRLLIIIYILFFTGFSNVFSQEQEKTTQEKQLEEKAFALFREEKYSEALPLMSQLLSMFPKEPDYNFGYAVCLIETNQQTEKAIKYLLFADSKSDNPKIKYYLGRAYHLNYKFDEALENYNAFATKATPVDKKKYQIDNMVSMCNNGKELIRFISDLTVVDNKKIKSENYFYSYELKDFGGKLIIKPPEFKSKIDKKLEKNNTVIFLPTGASKVYYGSYGEKNINGRDIYYIEKKMDGTWDKPVALGPVINTPYDEDFPYLQADGKTLFFSSKGHNSMGGYDIYKSVFDSTKGEWTKPINLDFPINTPYDDYMYIPDKDDLYAFFASNRETTGDNISVYKIIIDKQPIERQFNNLEEIINTSKLEVSSLADIKRVEKSRTDINKNPVLSQNTNQNSNTSNINIGYTNKYAPLTYSPTITKEQISSDVSQDEKMIKEQSDEIRKQSNMAYLAADEQNKVANDKRKQAADKTNELNKVTDPVLKEKQSQEIYDLITEAENIEQEAIAAYNIAKNLDQVATDMERDASKTRNLVEAINSSGNTDNQSLVEAVNKNKEKLNNSQKKYTSLESEIDSRANQAIIKQKDFEQIEKEYQANLNDMSSLEDEMTTIKQQIDNESDPAKKSLLNFQLEEKNTQLNQSQLKDSTLEEKYEKLKIEKENLTTEVNFLSSLKNRTTSDTRTPEQLASLTKNLNKDQLQKDIFNKELTADVKIANTITQNSSQENKNNNLTAENKEPTNTQLNENNSQNTQNNTTNPPNENKNIYKTNPVFPFSSDTSNSSSKLVAYQKEVLNAQYYDNLVKEQENQLTILQNTLNNVTDDNTKASINKQINNLSKDIEKNKAIGVQSNQTALNLKSAALSEVDTSALTNEQLVLNATQYKPVNKFNVTDEQKQTLNSVQNNQENLKETQKEFNVINSEIKDLEKKRETSDVKNQKIIDKEIETKRQTQQELLNKYAKDSRESNMSESAVYSDLIEKNKVIDVKNPNLRFANMLEKESEVYFEKAVNIRKDAELLDNQEAKKSEYQKADKIEQIAIQKQKYALDLYMSNHTLVASANSSNNNSTHTFNQQNLAQTADTNIVKRTTEITLNADEEQQLKTYRQESHKADVLLTEAKTNLTEVESKKSQAASTFSATEKKNILKGIDTKEQRALDMMLSAYKNYGRADSMKYMVYKNQIQQFQASAPEIGNNKSIAQQYTQEADFYFSEASKIRQHAETITDKKEKSDELARATEFEKKALTSQELAVDILTDVDPVFFVSTSDLTKVDRLDVLNQPVDVSTIIKIKTERIISKINPTEEELKKLDESEKRRSVSSQLVNDANKYKAAIDSLQNIATNSPNQKDKNKAQKQIPKLEKKMFASQFTSAEIDESINDARFYLYKNYFSKNRLNGNTTEARQGKQLEKDANSKYSKAKSLREKGFMKEDARKAYDILVEAKKLEEEAIDDQERAYGVYLGLTPLDDEIKAYADAHKNENKNENNLIVKSNADITHIEVPVDTTSQVTASNNLNNNEVKNTNTNPPDNNGNNNLIANNTQPVDTNTQITANNNIKNNEVKNTNTNPPDNNENTNNLNTNNQVNYSNSTNYNNLLNKEGFGFSVLPVNAYSNANPIPMNTPLPDGLVFKVQIGAFKAPVKNESFKGLNPITGETLPGSAYVRYYVGLFYSEDAAGIVRNQIRPLGYNDAFIVAYYNGKRISLFEARKILKQSTSPENYNQLAQAEVEKIKNRTTNPPVNQNQVNANQNQANNQVKANNAPVNSTNVNQITDLFYTVQIGVYKNPVTTADLKNLSPIYQDNAYGFIRYTTGKFTDPKKAESEKNRIVQLGISDAFVSAYYKGKKITLGEAAAIEKQNPVKSSNEVGVTYPEQQIPDNQNTENVNQSINKEDIVFKIQIASFKEQVPIEKVKEFLIIAATHDLNQEKDDAGTTIYSIGKYKEYNQALQMRDMLINEGFKDAFITAYNGKQKISVNDAKRILNQ